MLCETVGAVTASSLGTNVSGTTYVQLVAATTYDWQGFWVSIVNTGATVVQRQLTLGLGSAGNEREILPGATLCRASTVNMMASAYYVPVAVPAGSRIAGKMSGTTGAFTVTVTGVAASPMGTPPSGAGFAHGVGTNQGTAIDCGGAANTKGSWTQIVAATTYPYRYLMAFIGCNGNTTMADGSFLFDIGVGTAASEFALVSNLQFEQSVSGDMNVPCAFGPFPCDLPAGTRLAVRGQSTITDATDRVFDVTLVGFP